MAEMLTLVSGLGRCGTTMVMTMLAAGGAPVFGAAPAYEDARAARIPIDKDWLISLGGGVVKILDPHRGWRQQCKARVIWLDRDEKEQAKSQVKFLREVGGIAIPQSSWKAMRSGLRSDRASSMRILPRPILKTSFERILDNPRLAAAEMAEWFPELNVEAAAAVVRHRSPLCASDMSVEASLLRTA